MFAWIMGNIRSAPRDRPLTIRRAIVFRFEMVGVQTGHRARGLSGQPEARVQCTLNRQNRKGFGADTASTKISTADELKRRSLSGRALRIATKGAAGDDLSHKSPAFGAIDEEAQERSAAGGG